MPMAKTEKTEAAETDKLIATLVAQVEHDYTPPRVKRDAHPKMHGCVQAEFHVENTLPDYLQQGIFKNLGRTYCAWVRYSNAFHIQHDLEFETRGMAVKLLDVGEDNLVGDDGRTQDFLFATYDVFFLPNPDHYVEFAAAVAVGPMQSVGFFIRQRLFRGLWASLRSAFMIVRNPLAIRYYSQTPYRLGPKREVKLQASPRLTPALKRSLPGRVRFGLKMIVANLVLFLFEFPPAKLLISFFDVQGNKGSAEDFCDQNIAARDHLRLAMMSFLGEHDAWFDVLMQLRPGPNPNFIEDATKRWRSKFEKVATIRIPRQVFWPEVGMPSKIKSTTTEMMDLGENMSFNPWHALPAHEPLGPINKTRRRVYEAIVRTRHELNGVPPQVPTLAKYNEIKSVAQCGDVSTPPIPESALPCRSVDTR